MSETFINIILKNFFKISFSIIISGLFIYIMMPFLISIIIGGILAMAITPFVDYFQRRGLSRNLSLIIVSTSITLIGLVPLVSFLVRGSRIVTRVMQESNFSELTARFMIATQKIIEKFCLIYDLDSIYIEQKFNQLLKLFGNFLSHFFNNFISELPFFFMLSLITSLTLYFSLKEAAQIRIFFNRYFYLSKKNGNEFIDVCKTCCREVFLSSIMTGICQAIIVCIGAFIFNIGDLFLVFFITFICSFIPVIGAAPVATFLALLCLMENRLGAGLGMLVVAVVAGLTDNIIRSYLGTIGKVAVHPFIGFLSVIGGVIMFGLPGLFIGPLVGSLISGAMPIIIDEYFNLEKEL
jgi:predicted PurR-regulated permease PerM